MHNDKLIFFFFFLFLLKNCVWFYAETLIEKVIVPNVVVFGYEFMEIVFFAKNKVVVPIFSFFK